MTFRSLHNRLDKLYALDDVEQQEQDKTIPPPDFWCVLDGTLPLHMASDRTMEIVGPGGCNVYGRPERTGADTIEEIIEELTRACTQALPATDRSIDNGNTVDLESNVDVSPEGGTDE